MNRMAILVVIALILVLSISACGGYGNKSSKSNSMVETESERPRNTYESELFRFSIYQLLVGENQVTLHNVSLPNEGWQPIYVALDIQNIDSVFHPLADEYCGTITSSAGFEYPVFGVINDPYNFYQEGGSDHTPLILPGVTYPNLLHIEGAIPKNQEPATLEIVAAKRVNFGQPCTDLTPSNGNWFFDLKANSLPASYPYGKPPVSSVSAEGFEYIDEGNYRIQISNFRFVETQYSKGSGFDTVYWDSWGIEADMEIENLGGYDLETPIFRFQGTDSWGNYIQTDMWERYIGVGLTKTETILIKTYWEFSLPEWVYLTWTDNTYIPIKHIVLDLPDTP